MTDVRDVEEVHRRNRELQQQVEELEDTLAEFRLVHQALRDRAERLGSLFDNAPMGYQSLDEQGDLIDVNDTWCRSLGYDRDELIGHNFSEFLFPDYREHFRHNFPRFKKNGFIRGVEFKMLRKDGSTMTASICMPVITGGLCGLQFMVPSTMSAAASRCTATANPRAFDCSHPSIILARQADIRPPESP